MPLTMAELKDQMPDIPIQLAKGLVVMGWLRGRKGDFPVVVCTDPRTGLQHHAELSWDCALRAANGSKVILG